MRVLIIDDDRELCDLIHDYLAPLGYETEAVHDGPTGAERAVTAHLPFDAVILDVMLPGADGFEVLRRIRRKSDVPVLMLTARGEETDRIVGLEMGADDYLPKTFSSRELLARLRAVVRRHVARPTAPAAASSAPAANASSFAERAARADRPQPEIVVGELRINPDAHLAVLGDTPLKLTALEFSLLESLARARGRVRTREHLIETLGERLYDGLDRSIDVHVWSLRRKLGDDPKNPRFIRTVRAVGYMLINPDAE